MPFPAVMSPPWSMKPLITCTLYMFSNPCSKGHPWCQVETKAMDMAHMLVMYPMEAVALEMQRLPRLLSCSSFSSA